MVCMSVQKSSLLLDPQWFPPGPGRWWGVLYINVFRRNKVLSQLTTACILECLRKMPSYTHMWFRGMQPSPASASWILLAIFSMLHTYGSWRWLLTMALNGSLSCHITAFLTERGIEKGGAVIVSCWTLVVVDDKELCATIIPWWHMLNALDFAQYLLDIGLRLCLSVVHHTLSPAQRKAPPPCCQGVTWGPIWSGVSIRAMRTLRKMVWLSGDWSTRNTSRYGHLTCTTVNNALMLQGVTQ